VKRYALIVIVYLLQQLTSSYRTSLETWRT